MLKESEPVLRNFEICSGTVQDAATAKVSHAFKQSMGMPDFSARPAPAGVQVCPVRT